MHSDAIYRKTKAASDPPDTERGTMWNIMQLSNSVRKGVGGYGNLSQMALRRVCLYVRFRMSIRRLGICWAYGYAMICIWVCQTLLNGFDSRWSTLTATFWNWCEMMWVFSLQGHAVLCPFNHARDGILCYPVRLGRNSQQACRRGRKAACHDKVEPDSCERMIWSALRCFDAYSIRTCSSLPQSHPATSYSIISTSTCLHGRTMIAAFLDRQVSTALQMALLNCCVTGQNLKASATGTREP